MKPGARVRMKAQFLRDTGQYSGQDCHSRWTVQSCGCYLCKGGDYVAVNERSQFDSAAARHINAKNLEGCR
jgi:hypothetical protein